MCSSGASFCLPSPNLLRILLAPGLESEAVSYSEEHFGEREAKFTHFTPSITQTPTKETGVRIRQVPFSFADLVPSGDLAAEQRLSRGARACCEPGSPAAVLLAAAGVQPARVKSRPLQLEGMSRRFLKEAASHRGAPGGPSVVLRAVPGDCVRKGKGAASGLCRAGIGATGCSEEQTVVLSPSPPPGV